MADRLRSQRAMREESFENVYSSEISNEPESDASEADGMEVENTDTRLMTVRDVQNALHPLQAAADRVGKQVEKFAENLDKYYAPLGQSAEEDCRRVLPLVCEYEKIAADTVKSLKKYHEPERQERLKGSWKRKLRRASRTPTPQGRANEDHEDLGSTTVEDLQRWEQERQTWQLLRLLLQTQYPPKDGSSALPDQEKQFQRPRSGQAIHRYSSEGDVWNAFLSDFDDVWEKNVVVEWLKASANCNGQDIRSVIEELEEGADRGAGLSAHGWLYSKEAVKAQKRLRSWADALDPGSPGIDDSLVSKNKKQKIVTQLDPDAFSRQNRDLESEDVYFERATWLGCWEMLRRGQSWETIREFCLDRVEVWRALSLRGDPRMSQENGTDRDVVRGAQSRSLWRKMCTNAARDGGIDDYENAVYGVLGGDFPSIKKVTRSWDDYLFAIYSSEIVRQFDFYIQKRLPDRLPETLNMRTQQMFFDETKPSNMSGEDVWRSLQAYEATKEEAKKPMKMLQGSLIAGEFVQHVRAKGLEIGQGRNRPKTDISEDYDSLRVLTHMALIFQDLEVLREDDTATENIVSAYIEFLGAAGKQDLLPLYASRMNKGTATKVIARQLPKIVEPAERETVLSLITDYELNPIHVLRQQLHEIADNAGLAENESHFPRLDMLEFPKPGSYQIPEIKLGFLQQDITDEQRDMIHGVEWYLLLDDQWSETMWAGALVYKCFLRIGAFAAAKELSQRVTFSSISLEKTRSMFGRTMDLSTETLEDSHPASDWYHQELLTVSEPFRDLEKMIFALVALEDWAVVAAQLEAELNGGVDPRHARTTKTKLQEAHDNVVSCVEPLLQNWLQWPADDEERAELETIRTAYLPDIVLGYIRVLDFDGHHLSRDILLQTMNLAVQVAGPSGNSTTTDTIDTDNYWAKKPYAEDPSNKGLSSVCATFQKAGRMKQLVDALAAASVSIMRADEMSSGKGGAKKKGVKKSRKSGAGGENMDIWNVIVPEI